MPKIPLELPQGLCATSGPAEDVLVRDVGRAADVLRCGEDRFDAETASQAAEPSRASSPREPSRRRASARRSARGELPPVPAQYDGSPRVS